MGNQRLQLRFLSVNRPGPRMGMGHYERLLLEALARNPDFADWRPEVIFSGRAKGLGSRVTLGTGHAMPARALGYSTARLVSLPWPVVHAAVSACAGRPRPSVYHSLALSFPAPDNAPAVYTIHDLPPARFPDEGIIPRWARAAVRRAAAIHTPSEFAKSELVDVLGVSPDRVTVIPYGCESDCFHGGVAPLPPSELKRLGIPGPFLLYVGGFTRRKNVLALLRAWTIIERDFPEVTLALAGPEVQLGRLASEAGARRVVLLGYQERNILPSLLKASIALVFPSIYEGFGMPPLEAMALGVPVVAVRAGAVPEVVGDCALLADEGSFECLAATLRSLLEAPHLQKHLALCGPTRAHLFSWDAHAQQILDLYEAVTG